MNETIIILCLSITNKLYIIHELFFLYLMNKYKMTFIEKHFIILIKVWRTHKNYAVLESIYSIYGQKSICIYMKRNIITIQINVKLYKIPVSHYFCLNMEGVFLRLSIGKEKNENYNNGRCVQFIGYYFNKFPSIYLSDKFLLKIFQKSTI